MLEQGTTYMAQNALRMLRRSLDLSEVARASGLNPKTARSDWNDERSNGSPDTFIVTFAHNHLFGMHAPWISDVWSRIVHQWPRDDSSPRDKFVNAMATIYRQMLRRPETIARWQMHLYVAAAQRSTPSGATSAVDDADTDADEVLLRELIDLRHEFDEHVTSLWQLPLRVVLAEMERRPRGGTDERTIARELHTSMDGHVLRSLAEARASDEDEARAVGWHTLLLLEGFTEPDVPAPGPPAGDLAGWSRDVAAHITMELHRTRSVDEKDDHANPVERGQVMEAVLGRCPADRQADLRRIFDQQFPDMLSLREAALRRCLQPRVEAVREMYEVIPAPVLRQLISSVRTAGSTDSFLLHCCRADQQSGASSYLTELESLLADLLVAMRTNRPAEIATILLGQALDGDHKAVDGLLTVIIPDSDERELAVLQAAATDQIGQEGGELGA